MHVRTLRCLVACLTAILLAGAAPHAREALRTAWTSSDDAALREMIEGGKGRREAWQRAPDLVILEAVMDFTDNIAAGAVATDAMLGQDDVTQLEADMTEALAPLTDGRTPSFASVTVEPVAAGQSVRLFRRGTVVVGRFAGVQERSGTLGFGGRTARDGVITSGLVVLDHEFDSHSSRRRVLRMHELGHALGYNHVESRPSVMNPRVGSDLTDFDRAAIAFANEQTAVLNARLLQ